MAKQWMSARRVRMGETFYFGANRHPLRSSR